MIYWRRSIQVVDHQNISSTTESERGTCRGRWCITINFLLRETTIHLHERAPPELQWKERQRRIFIHHIGQITIFKHKQKQSKNVKSIECWFVNSIVFYTHRCPRLHDDILTEEATKRWWTFHSISPFTPLSAECWFTTGIKNFLMKYPSMSAASGGPRWMDRSRTEVKSRKIRGGLDL